MSCKNKVLVSLSWMFILEISTGLMHAAQAGEVRMAVAANFSVAFKALIPEFEQATGHKLISSFASSGKLYAQIMHGAPFDIMLSADKLRPEKLQQAGLGVPNTRFTYARGKLVLWQHPPGTGKVNAQRLREAKYQHLAITNPKTAPYGQAAMEVLQKLDLVEELADKMVRGDNISQTLQYVHSGAADFGFIAFSQLKALHSKGVISHYWEIPENLYKPIEQQAILLENGRHNQAAHDFLNFLKQQHITQFIVSMGYAVSDIEGVLP